VKGSFGKSILLVICCLNIVFNAGCSSSRDVKGRDFEFSSIVKNDIDLVSEMHQQVVFDALKVLATKLYKRNPDEWKKDGHESLEIAVEGITDDSVPDTNGMASIDYIRLTFDEGYQGDRVKTFVVGLEAMVLASYGGDRSFYLYDMLDAQKLYDSARNLELASWLIRTKYDSNDKLFLLSSAGTEEINLSFERLFGKMINAQDMMAQIMADRNHRQINYAIQTIITAFIPIL